MNPYIGNIPDWIIAVGVLGGAYRYICDRAEAARKRLDDDIDTLIEQWSENRSDRENVRLEMEMVDRATQYVKSCRGVNRIVFPSRHRRLTYRYKQIFLLSTLGEPVWAHPMLAVVLEAFGHTPPFAFRQRVVLVQQIVVQSPPPNDS